MDKSLRDKDKSQVTGANAVASRPALPPGILIAGRGALTSPSLSLSRSMSGRGSIGAGRGNIPPTLSLHTSKSGFRPATKPASASSEVEKTELNKNQRSNSIDSADGSEALDSTNVSMNEVYVSRCHMLAELLKIQECLVTFLFHLLENIPDGRIWHCSLMSLGKQQVYNPNSLLMADDRPKPVESICVCRYYGTNSQSYDAKAPSFEIVDDHIRFWFDWMKNVLCINVLPNYRVRQ